MRSVSKALLLVMAVNTYPLHAFLGVGDVSLVTVVANPAEAANWASQIEALQSQLSTLQRSLGEVQTLRRFAGDPSLAARGASDLCGFLSAVRSASSGSGSADALQTDAEGAVDDRAIGAGLGTAGPGMSVQGYAAARDLGRYREWVVEQAVISQLRAGIAADQSAHGQALSALEAGWAAFQRASTESEKQASLVQLSQVMAQNGALDARRQSLQADMELSARARSVQDRIAAAADDEEIAANVAAASSRLAVQAQAIDTARLSALNRTPPTVRATDYSAIRAWSPP